MSNQVYSDPTTSYRSRYYTHVLGLSGAFTDANYTIEIIVEDYTISYIIPLESGAAIAASANSVNALPEHLRPAQNVPDVVYGSTIVNLVATGSQNGVCIITPSTGAMSFYTSRSGLAWAANDVLEKCVITVPRY